MLFNYQQPALLTLNATTDTSSGPYGVVKSIKSVKCCWTTGKQHYSRINRTIRAVHVFAGLYVTGLACAKCNNKY